MREGCGCWRAGAAAAAFVIGLTGLSGVLFRATIASGGIDGPTGTKMRVTVGAFACRSESGARFMDWGRSGSGEGCQGL